MLVRRCLVLILSFTINNSFATKMLISRQIEYMMLYSPTDSDTTCYIRIYSCFYIVLYFSGTSSSSRSLKRQDFGRVLRSSSTRLGSSLVLSPIKPRNSCRLTSILSRTTTIISWSGSSLQSAFSIYMFREIISIYSL